VLGNRLQILGRTQESAGDSDQAEQRVGIIDQLLNEANKQGEKTNVEGTPVQEVAPAK
jgi:hypothetical protein